LIRKPKLTAKFSSPFVICSVSTSILWRTPPVPSSLQTSFFGDVGGDYDLPPVGELRPAGIARIIRAAYLNHESA
jgi:hypothetical protein